MLDQEYEQLIHYLKGMIADGVQLVHGGHLFDWDDTNIIDLLDEIEQKKEEAAQLTYEVGDLLQNRYTGQTAAVVLVNDHNVQMNPSQGIIIFPKDKVWQHYRKSKPSE